MSTSDELESWARQAAAVFNARDLDGLLAGTRRFAWQRGGPEGGGQIDGVDQFLWEALTEGVVPGEG